MTNWIERLIGETQAKLLLLLRRSPRTITGLSEELRLTDNAVRSHVATLDRDGMVEQVGTQRDTGGKPARVYALTTQGEELFPKAYALVLAGLVEEIERTDGAEHAAELLRAVGRRAAASAPSGSGTEGRVGAAATLLRGIGADLEVERTEGGWHIQGYGCPLSAVTASRPQVCELVRAMVAEVTGVPVTECCDRRGRPRCAFDVAAAP